VPGRGRRRAPDGAEQHREWLSLIEVTGPFLSLPVLRATWPTLDPLDRKERDRLRTAHATWLDEPPPGTPPAPPTWSRNSQCPSSSANPSTSARY